ncbi:MAG: hypothetical protein ACFFCZ_06475 [Promethearchaeota archaeon]
MWAIDLMNCYVAIGEAPKLLGVCIKTIRRWDKGGKIQLPTMRELVLKGGLTCPILTFFWQAKDDKTNSLSKTE